MLRSLWMLLESPKLQHKLTRVLPHIIDTVLLVCGVWLAFFLQQYPFTEAWLTAKLLGLVVYILAGTVALKRGKTKRQRIVGLIIALLAFAYILAVAVTRTPWILI